jgi:hypothetical protein
MANELQTTYNGAATIYVIIRRISDAKVWDVTNSAWAAWVDGNLDDYDVALANKGGDLYAADAPSSLLDDVQYRFFYHVQAAGSPALTDFIIEKPSLFWGTEPSVTPPTPTTGTSGTVYCSIADVESIMATHGVTAFVDDDVNGSRSAAETQYISDAISRAAALKLNPWLQARYKLGDLSSNVWCRWANAMCAAVMVSGRRNNPVPRSLNDECKDIRETLKLVAAGKMPLPSQAESFDNRPTVSNFDPERWRRQTPVRVRADESTGTTPSGKVTRRTARTNRGFYWP